MRAADARAHIGKRVIVHTKQDIVHGSEGTLTAAKVDRSALYLVNDRGLPRSAILLRDVQSILDFTVPPPPRR